MVDTTHGSLDIVGDEVELLLEDQRKRLESIDTKSSLADYDDLVCGCREREARKTRDRLWRLDMWERTGGAGGAVLLADSSAARSGGVSVGPPLPAGRRPHARLQNGQSAARPASMSGIIAKAASDRPAKVCRVPVPDGPWPCR